MSIQHRMLVTGYLHETDATLPTDSANVTIHRSKKSGDSRRFNLEDFGIDSEWSVLYGMNKWALIAAGDELLHLIGAEFRHLSGPALVLAHGEHPWLRLDPDERVVRWLDSPWSERSEEILQAALGESYRIVRELEMSPDES